MLVNQVGVANYWIVFAFCVTDAPGDSSCWIAVVRFVSSQFHQRTSVLFSACVIALKSVPILSEKSDPFRCEIAFRRNSLSNLEVRENYTPPTSVECMVIIEYHF